MSSDSVHAGGLSGTLSCYWGEYGAMLFLFSYHQVGVQIKFGIGVL